jgi:hypothetical protein
MTSHRIESENERVRVPDYALDQHTQKGKNLGRSWDHWSEEGFKLSNEVEGLNVYRDQALALRKKHGRLKPKPEGDRRGGKKRNGDPGLFYSKHRREQRKTKSSSRPFKAALPALLSVLQPSEVVRRALWQSHAAFLRHLDLAQFGSDGFEGALVRSTKDLQAALPPTSRYWGIARKVLNIFLRDCLYTRYLDTSYHLHSNEDLFELPLDSNHRIAT